MPIKVLLADDSDVMRTAIRKILEEESHIKIVGEAATFAKTIQMIGDLKPDLLLLDLHMAEKREFTHELIKAQLGCVCTLAVSFSNDNEARQLAESYGAVTLLDKMKLYDEMVPAIMSQFKGKSGSKTKRSRTPLSQRTLHRDSDRPGLL
jgi:DNA-binding NarL/FixJ family response regulator